MRKILFATIVAMFTASGATVITTREQLAAIADNLAGSYALGADIDLSGFDWKPIGNGSAAFRGRFYGQGHSIRNLVCTNNPSENSYRGLFGCTRHAIIVRSLGFGNGRRERICWRPYRMRRWRHVHQQLLGGGRGLGDWLLRRRLCRRLH